jgi:ribosomal protein L11 methyltransferase
MTWSLRTAQSLDEVNAWLPALLDAGLLGIAEEDGATTIYLQQRCELPIPGVWDEVADQDWNETWKAGIEPVTVEQVTVVAPWLTASPDTPVVLVIEPAQAFGTGHHETTVACLAALQRRDLTGRTVFDVGTGTGVLALAAKALGARRVLGSDIDPVAVEAAALNAERNNLDVDIRLGSADVAQGEQFDVVIANLDTTTLSGLAVQLVGCLAADGVLIASGVSNERIRAALTALSDAGLEVVAEPGDEWALITAVRPI